MESTIELLKAVSENLRITQENLAKVEKMESTTKTQAEQIMALVDGCNQAKVSLREKKSALLALLVELAVKAVGPKEYRLKERATQYKTTAEGYISEYCSGGGCGPASYNVINRLNCEWLRDISRESDFHEKWRFSDERFWGVCELLLEDVRTFLENIPSKQAHDSQLVVEFKAKILTLAAIIKLEG